MSDIPLDEPLAAIAESLRERFHHVAAPTIRHLVHDVAAEFHDARIKEYVPVLTAHICRDRLLGASRASSSA